MAAKKKAAAKPAKKKANRKETRENPGLGHNVNDLGKTAAPFIERLPMQLGEWDPDGSSAACYAWFFFHKGAPRLPVRPIPPGTKDRLHRAADVRRFAKLAPAPLFDLPSP